MTADELVTAFDLQIRKIKKERDIKLSHAGDAGAAIGASAGAVLGAALIPDLAQGAAADKPISRRGFATELTRIVSHSAGAGVIAGAVGGAQRRNVEFENGMATALVRQQVAALSQKGEAVDVQTIANLYAHLEVNTPTLAASATNAGYGVLGAMTLFLMKQHAWGETLAPKSRRTS